MYMKWKSDVIPCLIMMVVICYNCVGASVTIHAELRQTTRLPCYENGTETVRSIRLIHATEGRSVILLKYFRGYGVYDNVNDNKYSLNSSFMYVTVGDIQISDAGRYMCTVTTVDNSVIESVFNIDVYAQPTSVFILVEHTRIDSGHSQPVKCQVPKVYPPRSLTFAIRTDHVIIITDTDQLPRLVDYDGLQDGTYSAERTAVILFIPEYNINKIRCEVQYRGPGGNVTLRSSGLDVTVVAKPGQPFDLRPESVSYRQIVFSFMPGHSNGFDQNLTILYRSEHNSHYTELDDHPHDVLQGARQEITMNSSAIHQSTTYIIKVKADNAYPFGSATLSEPLTLTTRDEVDVTTKLLRIKQRQDKYILSWPEPEGDYTLLAVERCFEQGVCALYNVTGKRQKSFSVGSDSNFTLFVYQDRDIVYRAMFHLYLSRETDQVSGNNESVGIIVGSALTAGVICTIIALAAVLLYRKRKARLSNKDNPYSVPDMTQEKSATRTTYVELSKKRNDTESEYETPTYVEPSHVAVQSNFVLSELSSKTMVWKGNYAVVYKGMFRKEFAAVKTTIDTNCKVIDVKWLMSQIKILQLTGPHNCLPRLLAFNVAIDKVAMVTKYEQHRDFKTFLTIESEYKQSIITANKSKQMALHLAFGRQIVEGMLFLRQQVEVDILCYQLSAQNILVGEGLIYKIINFACADDVKERQKYCMNNQDESIMPWLAPECILSVDEHTTASDVWSFGILLYEIASNGLEPYPDIEKSEIGSFVMDGNIMQAPPLSDHLYGLMVQCWRYDALNRPSWSTLRELLQAYTKQYAEVSSEYEILDD